MKKTVALKLAVSGLVLGVTVVGCKPASDASRPATLSAKAPRGEADAVKLYAAAQLAVQQGDLAKGLAHTEKAVELAPRDAGYRMLLGDLYLKQGRFQSAETSFADVLALDPTNARASLSIALAQIALGRAAQATAQLERLALTAAPGDVGLAFALAGQPQRAIEMLEPAARATGADGRTRQNLALAYALAGDWQKARVTAAQDVSPRDLNDRMQQWAALAQPKAAWTQVAALLNVTPAEDPGQPVRLALAPAADSSVQLAANEIPQSPAEAYVPAPTATVEAPTAYAAVAVEAAEPVESTPEPVVTEEIRMAEAVQSLVEAPVVLASAEVEPVKPRFMPDKKPRIAGRSEVAFERKVALRKLGRFVVQLGAFNSPAGVERAWTQASARYPLAADREPLSTTVRMPGKGTFHRLSVSGFGTHLEASRLCNSIRAKGGACFVRTTAGDAPVQWASRYSARG